MIPYRVVGKNDFRAYGSFALLVLTLAFFIWEIGYAAQQGQPMENYFQNFALVPCQVGQQAFGETVVDGIRSLFLHSSFTQFLMNMVFLWIFAPVVEAFLGHRRFLLFFFIVGFGGHVASILFNRGDCSPLIGTSGAIAGVMGAFLFLYPAKRIETFIPVMTRKFDFPAIFFVAAYLAMQALIAEGGPLSGTIAPYWDEMGGFVTGFGLMFLITLFKPAPKGDPFEHLD